MNPVLSMLRTQKNQTNGIDKKSFLEFAKSMQGKDPKAMVDELRASGKMSESQYQSLLKRAEELSTTLK